MGGWGRGEGRGGRGDHQGALRHRVLSTGSLINKTDLPLIRLQDTKWEKSAKGNDLQKHFKLSGEGQYTRTHGHTDPGGNTLPERLHQINPPPLWQNSADLRSQLWIVC